MVTKEQLLETRGHFTWCWGSEFFIETPIGNFIWHDPDYQGDNTIRPYKGTFKQFLDEIRVGFGRCKGMNLIKDYCGTEFTLIKGKE